MENEMKTYYAIYRGSVNLTTPIEAKSEDEAYEKMRNLPIVPSSTMDLALDYIDLDFELDTDFVSTDEPNDIYDSKLNKVIVKNAIQQAINREDRLKAQVKLNIEKQIDEANKQLVNVTKGISNQIEQLQKQLKEL